METQRPDSIAPAYGSRVRTAVAIAVACVCGWFTMELEILGVRMLAPYFGSAVYVVTGSVIGTFLLSLAAGYLLGGWLSGGSSSGFLLGLFIASAGVWTGILPFLTGPVCDWIFERGLDEKWGSLLAALALFAVPTVLLGTVSPTVVRWLTCRAEEAGFSAGLVLALSTAASFAGCVVTAFYLILYSMRLTLIVSGVILAVLGLCILSVSFLQRSKHA